MATMSILPEDLIEEILVRVPALTLKRLRFVCKQWNDLINDRRFTQKHLFKAKKQFLMMKLADNKVNLIDLDLHGIHPTLKSSGIVSFPYNVEVIRIFHCDGLLLCATRDSRVLVWNPCLEGIRWIEDRDVYNLSYRYCYSLGYDKNKDMYKILRFPAYDYFHNIPVELKIFDLNTDSWRILHNSGFPKSLIIEYCGVSLKGNGYWFAQKTGTEESYMILSFDFTRERFRCLCSPPLLEPRMILSAIRDERLSVLKEKDLEIEFWMSNEIDDEKDVMSWSKLFKVDFNGGMLWYVTSFLVDEEKKLAVFSIKKYMEDLGTIYVVKDGFETVEVDKSSKHSWNCHQPFLLSYAPSLVQIPKFSPTNKNRSLISSLILWILRFFF